MIIQARMVGIDPVARGGRGGPRRQRRGGCSGGSRWRCCCQASSPPALLAFTFSFDDIVTSYFLAGASQPPLPIVLFGMIRFQITPEINAIGVMIMLFTITLMTTAVVLLAAAGRSGAARDPACPVDLTGWTDERPPDST